jgi:hypothetical protein
LASGWAFPAHSKAGTPNFAVLNQCMLEKKKYYMVVRKQARHHF